MFSYIHFERWRLAVPTNFVYVTLCKMIHKFSFVHKFATNRTLFLFWITNWGLRPEMTIGQDKYHLVLISFFFFCKKSRVLPFEVFFRLHVWIQNKTSSFSWYFVWTANINAQAQIFRRKPSIRGAALGCSFGQWRSYHNKCVLRHVMKFGKKAKIVRSSVLSEDNSV